jgi:hypothetical protein
MLNRLNIVIFTQQFVFLLVGLVDTNGDVLKYYPYRTSALSAFFMMLQLAIYFKRFGYAIISQKLQKQRKLAHWWRYRKIGVLTITSGFFLSAFVHNIGDNVEYVADSPAYNIEKGELYAFIREHTAQDAMFLFYAPEDYDLAFIRHTERELFSVWKFIPTTNRQIYEWYRRVQTKQHALNDFTQLTAIRDEYGLDYVVAFAPLDFNELEIVFENSRYFLYAFKHQ